MPSIRPAWSTASWCRGGANLENVKLINGGLSISGVAGPVKASSVNGSIRAEKLEGQAELSTVNGRLEAGFDKREPAATRSR